MSIDKAECSDSGSRVTEGVGGDECPQYTHSVCGSTEAHLSSNIPCIVIKWTENGSIRRYLYHKGQKIGHGTFSQ